MVSCFSPYIYNDCCCEWMRTEMVRKDGTAPTVTIATANPSPISIKVSSAFLYTPILSGLDPGLLGCLATKICHMDGWNLHQCLICQFQISAANIAKQPSILPLFLPSFVQQLISFLVVFLCSNCELKWNYSCYFFSQKNWIMGRTPSRFPI